MLDQDVLHDIFSGEKYTALPMHAYDLLAARCTVFAVRIVRPVEAGTRALVTRGVGPVGVLSVVVVGEVLDLEGGYAVWVGARVKRIGWRGDTL